MMMESKEQTLIQHLPKFAILRMRREDTAVARSWGGMVHLPQVSDGFFDDSKLANKKEFKQISFTPRFVAGSFHFC